MHSLKLRYLKLLQLHIKSFRDSCTKDYFKAPGNREWSVSKYLESFPKVSCFEQYITFTFSSISAFADLFADIKISSWEASIACYTAVCDRDALSVNFEPHWSGSMHIKHVDCSLLTTSLHTKTLSAWFLARNINKRFSFACHIKTGREWCLQWRCQNASSVPLYETGVCTKVEQQYVWINTYTGKQV